MIPLENVKVKINTVQTVDQAGNEDVIELVTEATLEKRDDYFIVNYDESHITEVKGSKTRLKIGRNTMRMTKLGMFSSKMDFEEGEGSNNIYTTPYGSFDLYFYTDKYTNFLNEQGRGSILVEYKISFGKSEESYNKLKIDIF